MNKKVIALIVVIILMVIGVGVGVAILINNNENNNQVVGNTNNTERNTETENLSANTNIANNDENNNTENTGKVLIVYFSQTGNTETVANFIHEAVGGEIVKLETEQTYPSDYDELVDFAQQEQRENARPALTTRIENIDEYDTIFLGYPNWWGDMPMPIYTFLDEYDLSGKTIAPFITHGGSGLSGTPENIKEEEPNATVTDGLAISGSSARNSESDVREWLSEIGF